MAPIFVAIRRRRGDNKYGVWTKEWIERTWNPEYERHSDQVLVAVADTYEQAECIKEIAHREGRIVQADQLKAHKKAA